MRTNHALTLAMVAGILISVTGARALDAQQVPPPAYVIAEVEVTDRAAIQKYADQIAATLAPFSHHYVVRFGKSQTLEGEAPKGIVVIAFDSAEKARSWYDSPAYAAIKPIRQRAAKSRIFIVEGLPPQ